MKQDPRDAQIATLLMAIDLSERQKADENAEFWLGLIAQLRLYPGYFPAIVSVIRRREFIAVPNPFAFVRSASRGEAIRMGIEPRKRKPTKWCLGEAPAAEVHEGEDEPKDAFEIASDRWSFAEWHRAQVLNRRSDYVIAIARTHQPVDWAEVLMRAGVSLDVGQYIIDRLRGEGEKPTEAVRKAFHRAKPDLKAAIEIDRARQDAYGRKHVPKPYCQIAA